MKRKWTILQLYILGILGKHTLKAKVIKKTGLFKNMGGGGILASLLVAITS